MPGLKLDSNEAQSLTGSSVRNTRIDRQFVNDAVNRIISSLTTAVRDLTAHDSGEQIPVNITMPKPEVVVQRPAPPPREWLFEIERDGAGRVKSVRAKAVG